MMAGVQAAQVGYDWVGEVTEILDTNNYTDGLVSMSSTLTGRITWDTENYALSFPGSYFAYHHYIDYGENFSMSLTIDGNVDFEPLTGVAATVANDEPITLNDPNVQNWGGDGFYVESTNLRDPNGTPPPTTWDLPLSDQDWWMQFRFHSLSFDTWDTFDLPAELPLEAFLNQYIRISADDLTNYGWLQGDWLRFCREQNLEPSMSRRGNCWDNAVAESFFSSLKKERIKKRIYKTRDLARADVFDYIEVFYNRNRRHSHLGGVSPEAFERASL
jgi:putative transposase